MYYSLSPLTAKRIPKRVKPIPPPKIMREYVDLERNFCPSQTSNNHFSGFPILRSQNPIASKAIANKRKKIAVRLFIPSLLEYMPTQYILNISHCQVNDKTFTTPQYHLNSLYLLNYLHLTHPYPWL